jgi:hypothetical protein
LFIYDLGYALELGKPYFIGIVYNRDKKNFKTYINTELYVEDTIESTYYGADVQNYMIGGNWKESNGHLTGRIYMLNIFAEIFDTKQMVELYKEQWNKFKEHTSK